MKRFNWGWRIIIAFAVFTLGTSTWVAYAMSTEVDLVRSDYYEHSLKQDETAASQAHGLKSGAMVDYDAATQTLRVSIPNQQSAEGTLTLYRPSNPHADRHFDVTLDQNGTMQIPVKELASGLWRVILDWKSSGTNYELLKTFNF